MLIILRALVAQNAEDVLVVFDVIVVITASLARNHLIRVFQKNAITVMILFG